jgi:glucosamine kinase
VTRYLIGVDGGGTKTTLALADETGRELLRQTGPAGLVDPRRPAATAQMLLDLVAAARAAAGLAGPAAAMCAGLAGVGNRREREIVERTLVEARVAERVVVRSDGETALHGALAGGAGVLLIAGTGSVGYGRGEDGRVERCGGWGMVVGDEGSGYALGCESLRAALRGADGRGPATELLPILLRALDLSSPDEIPSWAGRAEKSEIAALAEHALAAARGGDGAAAGIVRAAAAELAAHAAALIHRLGPWRSPTPVVAHGGLTRDATFAGALTAALSALGLPLEVRAAAADAVAGAVALAGEAARGG